MNQMPQQTKKDNMKPNKLKLGIGCCFIPTSYPPHFFFSVDVVFPTILLGWFAIGCITMRALLFQDVGLIMYHKNF